MDKKEKRIIIEELLDYWQEQAGCRTTELYIKIRNQCTPEDYKNCVDLKRADVRYCKGCQYRGQNNG